MGYASSENDRFGNGAIVPAESSEEAFKERFRLRSQKSRPMKSRRRHDLRMDLETLRLVISVAGALAAGAAGALIAGLLARAASERAIAAAATQADRQVQLQREIEHEQWLRNQKQLAYQSFVGVVDGALSEWQATGDGESFPSLALSRSGVRIVGSVRTRKYAAQIAADLGLLRALAIVGADGQNSVRDNVASAFLMFIEAARSDLGASSENDASLGKDDVVEGRPLGVEPICTVLQVAPSTYYAAKGRAPSARAVSDAVVTPQLVTLWEANYRVYGARKLWKAARRAGIDIGRDQTARLMRAAGIEGATRTKRVRTTRPDLGAARHPDLVKREFTATAPNRLWVTDLTFVPTWAGVAYVCFIIDAFSRMIVGWRCASHMRAEMVLDAIEMARWGRGTHHEDLRCHSDAGSQFTSIRYGERLAEIGATPSIGTVGDSYDNALAETVNGYYKAELVRGPARPGPWKTVEDLELATLGWVHWHNTRRLHGYLGDVPPAEFENAFYADRTERKLPVEIK